MRALLPALEPGRHGGRAQQAQQVQPPPAQQQKREPGRPPKGKGKGKGAEEEDAAIMASKRAPHAVYGAQHLLRLLVSAPRFLAAEADADEEEVGSVQAYLQALLEHVAERRAALFAAHEQARAAYAPDVPRVQQHRA